MDPVSFAASLATLLGAVAASSKLMYNLRARLKNAPRDVESLLEQMRNFKGLLKELKAQFQQYQNTTSSHDVIPSIWQSSMLQMLRDIQNMHDTLRKLETQLGKPSSKSKIRLRARKWLSEKQITDYQRKLSGHCEFLAMIQLAVSNRKSDLLSRKISLLGDENRSSSQTITARVAGSTDQLIAESRTGFATVSTGLDRLNSAGETRYQETIARFDGQAQIDNANARELRNIARQQSRVMDTTSTGLDVLNTGFISSSREHKITRIAINRLEQLLQLSTRSSSVSDHRFPDTTRGIRCHYHHLPLGTLYIHRTPGLQSPKLSSQEYVGSDFQVTFVPPLWLSTTAIQYLVSLDCRSNASEWYWGVRLRPVAVNNHPAFLNAIKNLDVTGLRKCFRDGIARPSDRVLNNFLGFSDRVVFWHEDLFKTYARLGSIGQNEINSRILTIVQYMTAEGILGQESYIDQISHMFFSIHDELIPDEVFNCVDTYMDHRGELPGDFSDDSNVVYFSKYHKSEGIEWVPSCLQRSPQPLILDELSSMDICLLGLAAEGDAVFRTWLTGEIASYRSLFLIKRDAQAGALFESVFGTDSVIRHFWKMVSCDQERFLISVCKSNSESLSILQALINTGVDVNGPSPYTMPGFKIGFMLLEYRMPRYNMLGYAAELGYVKIIDKLLEAGANGALAIHQFCTRGHTLPDALFEVILKLLVEKSSSVSTSSNKCADALLGVIQSRKANRVYPEAPRALLDRGIVRSELLLGGGQMPRLKHSYMYQAIHNDIPSTIDLLLAHGACVDAIVGQLFSCRCSYLQATRADCFSTFTWLTLSMSLGATSSAEVLIRHGADIAALDGGGRSAVQLATSFATGPHPRVIKLSCAFVNRYKGCIPAETDTETLSIVKRAFDLKFGGKTSMEDYIASARQGPVEQVRSKTKNQNEPQPQPRNQSKLQKALLLILTPQQIHDLQRRFAPLIYEIQNLFALSPLEGLLVRLLFVLSYILLPILTLVAIANGEKRPQLPSRRAVMAVALLLLAVVWGLSKEES